MSHPVWVRGLKQKVVYNIQKVVFVAPRVGAWIETSCPTGFLAVNQIVAPRVGAWIETRYKGLFHECFNVAPRVGAWIETKLVTFGYALMQYCRTPCGCVD